MLRAIDVQMYVMGSSVYEERTWSKKSSTSETARPPPLPEPSSEPSRALKCPYSGANLQLSTQPAPPAEPTSEKAKCPYHGGDVSPAPKDVTEPTNEPASASKCPFSFGNDDDLTNGIDFGSDDDGEPASCPFGTIQPEVPAMTEDHFHLISSRFQTLAGLQSADNIFENQFLKQRCVFVSFDGTILPW